MCRGACEGGSCLPGGCVPAGQVLSGSTELTQASWGAATSSRARLGIFVSPGASLSLLPGAVPNFRLPLADLAADWELEACGVFFQNPILFL